MLGITVSLNEKTIEENINYLSEMKALGAVSVFTSLRIPEEDPEVVKKSVEGMSQFIQQNFQEFVVDVSPRAFDLFTEEWLKANNITTLRIDNGLTPQEILQLSQHFAIVFNASTLTAEFIDEIRSLGFTAEIVAWHNYYPRKDSGLDAESFKKQNHFLKQLGVKVGGFIPGDKQPRGTIYEWLPTVEKHRYLSPFYSFLDLTYTYGVDQVILGDYGFKGQTKQCFLDFFEKEAIGLQVEKLKDERILGMQLCNRIDICQTAIRAAAFKKSIQNQPVFPNHNNLPRNLGDVTIDNQFYGRYMGELQIVLEPLEKDTRINTVAKVSADALNLLPFLKYHRIPFIFKK